MKNEDILKENNGKKFSIILMNPPYDNGLHEKFLLKALDISDKVVSVQPITWLLGKKQNKKITNKIDNTKTEIENIPQDSFKDAAIGTSLSIIFTDSLADENNIKYDNQIYHKCEDIDIRSNDKYITEFKNIIKDTYINDNLEQHLHTRPFSNYKKYHVNNQDENKYIVRIPRFAGDGHRGITPDYFTIIPKKYINDSVGLFKELKDKTFTYNGGRIKKFVEYYFDFDTNKEAENFKNYLLTDFARTSLYLSKTNIELIGGRPLESIPWFDFSDEHFSKSPREIDDWLFKKYNISDEIRKHIEEILPDYYNIR